MKLVRQAQGKRKLAIFDIDGTIFRSSLVIEMFEELVRVGLFPKVAKKEVENTFIAWINRKGSYNDYIWNVVELYIKYIKGCSEKDVDLVTEIVIKNEKDKVYRFSRDLTIPSLSGFSYLRVLRFPSVT